MYNDKTIEKLKQKILDLAIRGKLVPQDPNDEPASILIEKIRKEKEKLIKEGKIKKPKEDSFIFKGSDNLYYENVNGKVKCIQDEIPFEIPESWCWARVNSILNFIDYRGVTPHKINHGIPLVTAKNIKKGFIDYQVRDFISKEEYINRQSRGISRLGDILFTTEAPLGNVALADKDVYSAGQRVITFQQYTKTEYLNNELLMFFILSDKFQTELNKNKTGSTVFGIKSEKLKFILIPVLPFEEQKRIINRIRYIKEYIENIKNQYNSISKLKEILKVKVLDLFFSLNSSYKSYYENDFNLGEILEYEQPAPYIVENTDYNDSFDTPVLTPGKTFILGYTDEKDGIYKADKDNKVIIFDDFTTASRLVDFNFKVKSSAMKILHISDKTKFDIDYMYYLLQTINIIVDTHKRFWISEYASLKVKIHTFDEQVKIKDKINSIYKIFDNL